MPRPKKNESVNEEVKTEAVEEKKPVKRGRKKKNPDTAVEIVDVEKAAETLKADISEKKEEKQPAKRGRRKKVETVEEKTEKKEEKQPVKRTRKKKTESEKETIVSPVKKLIVQYKGQEIEEKEIIERIEKAWRAEGNTAVIESIIMYVKPEDGRIYYLVNGLSGSIELF